MPNCMKCENELGGKSLKIGPDMAICESCAQKLENLPDKCPVCGHTEQGDEAVALLLTRATATPAERIGAHSALVHVCPKCGVLYFDGFQRTLLELLKSS